MVWVYPDERVRTQALTALFGLAVADANRAGVVTLVRDGAHVVGVAAWLPPGAFPVPVRRQLRGGPEFTSVLRCAPRAVPRLMRFLGVASRPFPAEGGWQLSAIGVLPASQGLGIGTALLAVGLRRASNPVHLETWNPRNPGNPGNPRNPRNPDLYARHGFTIVSSDLPLAADGPRRWAMIRRDRAAPADRSG